MDFFFHGKYTEVKEEQDGQVLDCSCSQAREEAHEGPGRLPPAIPAPACSEAPHLDEEGQQRPWAAFRYKCQKPPCQAIELWVSVILESFHFTPVEGTTQKVLVLRPHKS
ncbi:hypothetical protein P7K49_007938 [Saguinus oedipus]|uniref:Uncharacterized protein n=1 Tax=Saguinus oedipus TaxID=9490 RepID=A0ABQ9VWD9_SAGOE|nr:hypothetical protein P7K49_007938 [Saguinus oedipus]